MELKPLPNMLKYAFLDFKTLSVIISSNLDKNQEGKLLDVLSEHKKALGWTIADIKRISPSVIVRQIHLEGNAKTSREPQKRLNPALKEVVRVEVLKLIDVDSWPKGYNLRFCVLMITKHMKLFGTNQVQEYVSGFKEDLTGFFL